MKSKTIILSSENEKGRGILTLFHENDLLQCRIRLYNITQLNKFCKIGIYHQKQVYSANMLEKNGVYTSSLVGDFDIDKDFYSAIVDTKNNNNVILSGGTYAGYYFNDNSVFINEFESPLTDKTEIEQINNDDLIMENYNPYLQHNTKTTEQINNECENDCDKCKNCKYKEFFYSQTDCFSYKNDLISNEEQQLMDKKETEPQEQKFNNMENQQNTTNEANKLNIISSLIPQFKYVFENYPQDDVLCGLLPNGKFVKINENGDEFSIGAIYKDDEMKYICYAVLCDYNSPVPVELGEHHQWLPLDKEDPLSQGYYIVFQDAQDLKIVEL